MLSLIFSPVLLAMALSLDGFGAGITYGLRRTKIPLLSVLIISLCSGLVLCISMQAGVLLQRVFSPAFASIIGAVILIALGCWSFIQQIRSRSDRAGDAEPISPKANTAGLTVLADGAGSQPQTAVFSLEIRKLGLVIQILRSPTRADMDDSGSISSWEAMWLGIALSLDAFGAGLGAAMLGFSPLLTSGVVALFSGLFLVLGMKTGFRVASKGGMRFISYAPAFLLIFMGIMKLL
ncbi:putative sporulation protein YtaF [Paenibacillus uliginis N3/975]|uniref:Putative sporulation protein YtaF n=1 Tax=Paenibacillus uliginis N3/975 TaxID=1313296 RepID=A0A1X7H0G2_9BACL|nr:sporulation membrane protein YtaF [Paenibacillus uliginis]SMF76812.1 putative sporulation protein YtaF [Paenibacillus uliginis N3/975]